ncbi:hypothetical protein [Halioxenophilus sp. WMMB6]|uniref:hypothetical protein n=1 Tax=Halioxenophilus sp. WMMB6 TaxID=3073815 RepID=UPI00295F4974|nr:hypothetical protein [Halioxenophilus sp. WMMB6]
MKRKTQYIASFSIVIILVSSYVIIDQSRVEKITASNPASVTSFNEDITHQINNKKRDKPIASSLASNPLEELEDYKASIPKGLDYETDHWCLLSQLNSDSANQGIMETSEWALSRGYADDSIKIAYSSYDTSTLDKLAEQGDVIAYSILFSRLGPGDFINHKKDYDSLVDSYYKSASALGSTAAINWKAIHHINRSKVAFEAGNNNIATEELIKFLAYYEVAFRRGDYTAFSMIDYFVNKVDIEIDDDIVHQVEIEAREIYKKMSDERRAMGLGEFDNTRPLSRERIDQMRIASVTRDSKNPWIERFIPNDDCMKMFITMQSKINAAEEYIASNN